MVLSDSKIMGSINHFNGQEMIRERGVNEEFQWEIDPSYYKKP